MTEMIKTTTDLETALNHQVSPIATTEDAAAFLNWVDDTQVKLGNILWKYSAAQGLQDRVKAAANNAKNDYGNNVRFQAMRTEVLDGYEIKRTGSDEIDLVHK